MAHCVLLLMAFLVCHLQTKCPYVGTLFSSCRAQFLKEAKSRQACDAGNSTHFKVLPHLDADKGLVDSASLLCSLHCLVTFSESAHSRLIPGPGSDEAQGQCMPQTISALY
jgi:hypothetical protein